MAIWIVLPILTLLMFDLGLSLRMEDFGKAFFLPSPWALPGFSAASRTDNRFLCPASQDDPREYRNPRILRHGIDPLGNRMLITPFQAD